LAAHYTFFVSLLSFSPWCGACRRVVRDEEDMKVDGTGSIGLYRNRSLDEVLAIAQSKGLAGESAAPSFRGRSSSVLAQVLGFKFGYYQVRILSHLSVITLIVFLRRRM
jgi:THO complex subunit 2